MPASHRDHPPAPPRDADQVRVRLTGLLWRHAPLLVIGVAGAGVIALALALTASHGGSRISLLGVRLSLASPLRPAVVAALCCGLTCTAVPRVTSGKALRRLAVLLFLVSLFVVAVAWVRTLPNTAPIGDAAALSLRTLRMLDGRQFTGMYSRLGWDHPGPAVFAVLAPLYAASGYREASHAATAVLVNTLAVLALLHVTRSHSTKLALAGVLALLVIRVPGLTTSSWPPHILLLPMVLYVGLAARLASGEIRRLPIVVLLGSALVQAHVGVSVCVAGVLGAAMLLAHRRIRVADAGRAVWATPLNRAAWAALAAWCLPLAEQLTSREGNLGRLAAFAASGGETVPLWAATTAFASPFAGLVLPGFRLALGWATEATGGVVAAVVAACLLVGLLLVALPKATGADDDLRSLARVTLTGAVLGFWSATRITGGLADHLLFWVAGLGVLALACLLALAAGHLPRPVSAQWPVVATIGLTVLMVGAGVLRLETDRDPYSPFVRSQFRVMHDYWQSHLATRAVVGATPEQWADAAGVVLLFRKAGLHVGVTPDLNRVVGDPDELENPEIEFRVVEPAQREQMMRAGGWTWLRTLTPDIDVLARPVGAADRRGTAGPANSPP